MEPALGEDYIEPHVVGEDGYGYLRFYEMTGNTKYLRAAIHCADALVKNYKAWGCRIIRPGRCAVSARRKGRRRCHGSLFGQCD